METAASVIATILLALTLYFSSLSGIKKKGASAALDTKSEIDGVKAHLQTLSEENATLKTQVRELGDENKKLTGQVDGLTNKLDVLRDEGRQTIIDYTQALRDLLTARQALAAVEKQYIEASNQVITLTSEKGNLIQANENLARQLAENTQTLQSSQSANSVALQTIEDLKLQKAKLEGEIIGLKNGYASMTFVLTTSTPNEEEESQDE